MHTANWPGINTEVNAGVKKTIPVAAGLGGGSSNAAAALLAANLLNGHALSESELAEVAIQIGSDVPFFLSGGCALVAGRGEIRKQDLPVPNVWIVLANPGVELSTPDAFGDLRKFGIHLWRAYARAGRVHCRRATTLESAAQRPAGSRRAALPADSGNAGCIADAYPPVAALGERRHVLWHIR